MKYLELTTYWVPERSVPVWWQLLIVVHYEFVTGPINCLSTEFAVFVEDTNSYANIEYMLNWHTDSLISEDGVVYCRHSADDYYGGLKCNKCGLSLRRISLGDKAKLVEGKWVYVTIRQLAALRNFP